MNFMSAGFGQTLIDQIKYKQFYKQLSISTYECLKAKSVRMLDFNLASDLQTSEGRRKELMVGSNTPLSRILPPLITHCNLLQNPLFHSYGGSLLLSSAKSSNLPTGILVAERLYFSLSLYRSQGQPVFLFPSFNSLCIRFFWYSFLLHDQPIFC